MRRSTSRSSEAVCVVRQADPAAPETLLLVQRLWAELGRLRAGTTGADMRLRAIVSLEPVYGNQTPFVYTRRRLINGSNASRYRDDPLSVCFEKNL